jgi:hypothetical protein
MPPDGAPHHVDLGPQGHEGHPLLREAEEMIQGLDKAYEESKLPEKPDKEFALSQLLNLTKFLTK